MFQPCDLAEDRLLHCAHLASVNEVRSIWRWHCIVSLDLTLSFDSASDLYYKVGFDDGLVRTPVHPQKILKLSREPPKFESRLTEIPSVNQSVWSSHIDEFGLHPWKVVMVGVMHNLGMLVSMVIVGWLTDRCSMTPLHHLSPEPLPIDDGKLPLGKR
ncbi:hypothetical protein EVAR_100260_1 [Eumeta japonica]|uniref:Uncharacterized protein n=1 Tax=Eumeta variegata TaxID=151549 RepID=A0A4C1TTN8_EUMVA|nr:hypothetical protein EVAR_100260_1 [Eumeta japonica]